MPTPCPASQVHIEEAHRHIGMVTDGQTDVHAVTAQATLALTHAVLALNETLVEAVHHIRGLESSYDFVNGIQT